MPGFVISPAKFCQLLLSFVGYFDVFPKEMWQCVTVVRKCDRPKEVCQLMERCDGHGGGVGGGGSH